MSYLTLAESQILNLNKATISIWFRIPKATADAVEFLPTMPDYNVFDGIIPLLVFGQQKIGATTDWIWTTIGYTLGPGDPAGGPPTVPVQELLPAGSHPGKMAPTFIGVDKDGYIGVHIQTGDVGTAANLRPVRTEYLLIFTETDPGSYVVTLETEYADLSSSHLTAPDAFGNDGFPTNQGRPHWNGFQVTFNQWHHLLLSWDIKDENASHGYTNFDEGGGLPENEYIDKSSLMYCAIDDVNKNGEDLPGIRVDGMAPNETISYGTWFVEGQSNLSGSPDPPSGPPTYSVGFEVGVKADGMHVPAALEYGLTYAPYSGIGPDNSSGDPIVSPVRKVEMAELQVFAGIMLDTSVEKNRRAFVSAGGEPVPANDKAGSISLLGRRPDILLHGSGNWGNGKNTGSIGIDGNGDPIAAGQFQPTGAINSYKPDPSLHGQQSPGAVRLTRTRNARL